MGARFNLFDGMLLVAGLAIGLYLARDFFRVTDGFQRPSGSREPAVILALSHVLYGVTLAALFVQLRRLHPPIWREGRRPGLAGCLAVVVGSAFQFVQAYAINQRSSRIGLTFLAVTVTRPAVLAGAIAAAWLALIVSGRWRPAAAWPDRLGRSVGAAWLLLCFASWLSFFW